MVFWEGYRIYKNNYKRGSLRLSLDIADIKRKGTMKLQFCDYGGMHN